MKIVIVGTAHPYRGGLAAFNERLAQQFVAEGHDVEMITFTLQYPAFLFPGKTQFSESPAPKNLQISRQINSVNPFSWLKTAHKISKNRPNIVIFAYWMSFMAPCMGTISRIVRKNGVTKCIALTHNLIPHEKTIIDKLFTPYFVRSIDGFVALSASVVADIERFDKNHKPKCFSPHPIYDTYGEQLTKTEALQRLKLDTKTHYVLFFGFIRAYKGLDLLLEAFGDKRLEELNVKLIVAGEFYGDSKPYFDKIEQLGIKNRLVLCTDFIADDAVNTYFCAADIVAQPYKSATQSGVTQIAFHFNKPMLVTNVGGLPEIVPNGKIGYVVEPDAQQIADALVDFYQEKRETDFVKNVGEEKKKYAWANITKAIFDTAEKITK